MKKIIFLLIAALAITSCNKKEEKNVLNYPLSGQISTLDPANSYDTISASVIYQGYEQLFEYHYLKRPYTLQPLLASKMPLVELNGTKYTISIKKNVQYHEDIAFNGKKRLLKAEDFINQIKRLAYTKTNSNGWWLFDGKIKGLNKFRNEAKNLKDFEKLKVEGLYTLDEHTLVIELLEPYPQMLWALAMGFTSPMPIEAIKKYNNILHDKIIGTGAYELKSWTRSSNLKMKRFKNYHKNFYPGEGDRIANSLSLVKDAGKVIPFLDGIHYKIIKESQTRWLNFRNKNIHFLNIPKDNYSSTITPEGSLIDDLKKEKVHLEIFPTLTYWWVSFNMNDEILGKNLNLRKAIAHAINVERYIDVFTNNIGLRANSIYPPGVPGYDPSTTLPYEFNLDKARKFLKEAGYPDGKGLPSIKYDVRGASATNKQQAEFIKNQLGKIGIKIVIELNTFPAFLEKSRSGKLQLWLDGWAMDYPDSENVLQLLITKNHAPGPNSTHYTNPKFDKLFNQLRQMTEGEKKYNLMAKMEQMIHEDLPWVMLYYSRNYILFHDPLKNYRHSDLIYNNVKYLRLQND